MLKEAQLLEGKILAAKIQDEIKTAISSFAERGQPTPGLLVLQANHDPSSDWYIGQQEKLASKLGIHFEKIGTDTIQNQRDLIKQLHYYNEEYSGNKFHGIFMAMPFPNDFDKKTILRQLDPTKDVEGVSPATLGLIMARDAVLIPPTAFAAFTLIESTGVELRGKRVAVVGQSAIVGKPIAMLLGEKRATVTICNTGTVISDLQKIVSESDVVVACAGQPGMVKGNWIKEGAIVIDVGTTEVNGKLVGDVEFEEAKKRASYITPVPGGVGPLTVTMLMQNLIHAYKWQNA